MKSIEEFFQSYLLYLKQEKKFSEHTCRAYEKDVSEFLWHVFSASMGQDQSQKDQAMLKLNGLLKQCPEKDLALINLKSLQSHIFKFSLKHAAKTVARRLSSIKSFLEFAYRHQKINNTFFRSMDSPKLTQSIPDILSEKHVLDLLESGTYNEKSKWRDRLIVELLYGCALRVSELVSLNVKDIDVHAKQLLCLGKGNKERLIPMHDKAIELFQHYINKGRATLLERLGAKKKTDLDTEALLLNLRGKRIGARGIVYVLQSLAIQNNMNVHLHPHLFRHSIASHLLSRGVDLRLIQDYLGHENLQTTQIYTHTSMTQLQDVYRKAHPKRKNLKS